MLLRLRLAKFLCEQVRLIVSGGHEIQLDASPIFMKDVSQRGQWSRKVFGLGATGIPLHKHQR